MAARRMAELLAQRLLALFLAGWVLFDFPLLRAALGGAAAGPAPTLFGVPRLPLLLFAAWALLIALLAWLMERGHETAESAEAETEAEASREGTAPPDGEPAVPTKR